MAASLQVRVALCRASPQARPVPRRARWQEVTHGPQGLAYAQPHKVSPGLSRGHARGSHPELLFAEHTSGPGGAALGPRGLVVKPSPAAARHRLPPLPATGAIARGAPTPLRFPLAAFGTDPEPVARLLMAPFFNPKCRPPVANNMGHEERNVFTVWSVFKHPDSTSCECKLTTGNAFMLPEQFHYPGDSNRRALLTNHHCVHYAPWDHVPAFHVMVQTKLDGLPKYYAVEPNTLDSPTHWRQRLAAPDPYHLDLTVLFLKSNVCDLPEGLEFARAAEPRAQIGDQVGVAAL